MKAERPDFGRRAAGAINARDAQALERAYDDWAETYDADHEHFGGALMERFVDLCRRNVPRGAGPILDAGAGTGRLARALRRHGYDDLTGIDLSAGMLEKAKAKGVYKALHRMRLGGPLSFPDDAFAAVVSLGAMSPGHVGADAFDELIRITRPGGRLVLSMRAGEEQRTGFASRRRRLESEGRWRLVEETPVFDSHPELDPPLRYSIHVYRIPAGQP